MENKEIKKQMLEALNHLYVKLKEIDKNTQGNAELGTHCNNALCLVDTMNLLAHQIQVANNESNDESESQIELSDAILECIEKLSDNAVDARFEMNTERFDTLRQLIEEVEAEDFRSDVSDAINNTSSAVNSLDGESDKLRERIDAHRERIDELYEVLTTLSLRVGKLEDKTANLNNPERIIDWEQRRYETAKDCLQFAADYDNVDYYQEDVAKCVKLSIAYADELIKQLKS